MIKLLKLANKTKEKKSRNKEKQKNQKRKQDIKLHIGRVA